MPVIPKWSKPKEELPLRIPQARVLQALMPDDSNEHWVNWPSLIRTDLASAAGFNPTTGTINRVLNGVPEGSSSGAAHPGLLERGLLKATTLGVVDNVTVTTYRITDIGIAELQKYLATNKIPTQRDKVSCSNDRYGQHPSMCVPGLHTRIIASAHV